MYPECVGSVKVSESTLCDQAEYPVTETQTKGEKGQAMYRQDGEG